MTIESARAAGSGIRKIDEVNKKPHQPSVESRQTNFTKVCDRCRPDDNRHTTAVFIFERLGLHPGQPIAQQLGNTTALLNRHRSYSRQRIAAGGTDVGDVADDKNLPMRGQQVGLDHDSASTVDLRAGFLNQ